MILGLTILGSIVVANFAAGIIMAVL